MTKTPSKKAIRLIGAALDTRLSAKRRAELQKSPRYLKSRNSYVTMALCDAEWCKRALPKLVVEVDKLARSERTS